MQTTKLKPIASNFAHLIKQENVENGEFSAAFIQETDPYPDPQPCEAHKHSQTQSPKGSQTLFPFFCT